MVGKLQLSGLVIGESVFLPGEERCSRIMHHSIRESVFEAPVDAPLPSELGQSDWLVRHWLI